MKHTVIVDGWPSFEVPAGTTLLEACEAAGVPMECACGGFAACNSCRVTVLAGGEHLGAIEIDEACFLDEVGQRLGCQIRVQGDLRCVLSPGM